MPPRGIEVIAYATPHDSVGSVGYRFLLPGGQKIAVATDLGQVTGEVYDGVRGCDLALLEANYDPELLRMGRYPYFLKRRISGNDGHLANPSCAEFACGLLRERDDPADSRTSFAGEQLSRPRRTDGG